MNKKVSETEYSGPWKDTNGIGVKPPKLWMLTEVRCGGK
jgi:hypothetical protein